MNLKLLFEGLERHRRVLYVAPVTQYESSVGAAFHAVRRTIGRSYGADILWRRHATYSTAPTEPASAFVLVGAVSSMSQTYAVSRSAGRIFDLSVFHYRLPPEWVAQALLFHQIDGSPEQRLEFVLHRHEVESAPGGIQRR